MQLPQTAEYALRVMSYLATMPPGTGMRARDLSAVTDVPAAFLSKILRRLVVAGLLLSQKGHGGGFVLAKPHGKIRFSDVLDAVEFNARPNYCAFGWGRCNAARPCLLHPLWSKMVEEFSLWARSTTLEDVRAEAQKGEVYVRSPSGRAVKAVVQT